MFRHTFKVKKDKNADSHTFVVDMPKTEEDKDLIRKRFGSMERMIDRANAQWTVDVAPGMRKRLPDLKIAQEYADAYCDDGRKDTFTPSVVIDTNAPDAPEFTPEQLAYIKASGAQVA